MSLVGCVAAASTSSTPLTCVGSHWTQRTQCRGSQNVNFVGTHLGNNVDRVGKLKVSSNGSAFNGTIRVLAAPAGRATQRRSLEVSAMSKREQQLVDIRKMSDEDIGTTVVELKGELFVLRCKQATRQEYNSSEFRKIRKQVARMLTIRRERELEKGITMRESRKLDREWKKNIVVKPPASLASLNKQS